jgi:hypothetical protein
MKIIERLTALPVIFTLNDLVRLGLTRETAHTTVMRWVDRGVIAQAGPRAGVYFNLLADRQAPQRHRLAAAKLLYPSAIVIGAAVLHAHGWTTQPPQTIDVAILEKPTAKQLTGLHLVMRPRSWYERFVPELLRADESPFEIESLPPAAALADAQAWRDIWVPDPDDLDIPEDAEAAQILAETVPTLARQRQGLR